MHVTFRFLFRTFTMKMKFLKNIYPTLFIAFVLISPLKAWANRIHDEPLFQLGGGLVYSSIDLSRYTNSVSYRGIHARLVTHLGGLFFLSTEYSTFPVHASFPAWDNIHTRKFDINPQISFATENKRTNIFVFTGANYHKWKGRRTALADIDQLGKDLPEGAYAEVKKWGVNFGCGFNAMLYENISLFGDYRFNFGKANDFEKVRIMDVMTTIGLSFSIPYPEKSNRKKTFGIGKRIYKWTDKGGK